MSVTYTLTTQPTMCHPETCNCSNHNLYWLISRRPCIPNKSFSTKQQAVDYCKSNKYSYEYDWKKF